MINKKGSHVGMIISFVIFITFIVFIYVIISPAIKTEEDKKGIITYLEKSILNNVSTNFLSASIVINEKINQECIQLEGIFAVLNIPPPYQIIVKNEEGALEDRYIIDIGVADLKIDRMDKEETKFKIYYSPEFEKLSNGDIKCELTKEYSIGSVNTGKYVFNDNIDEFKINYEKDYEKLKEELKIPPGTEFGFDFIESDGTKIEIGKPIKSVNVYAEELPIQYLDNQANIHSGFINIKVW